MERLFTTQIPVAPEDEAKFMAWAKHFDCEVKKNRGSNYFTVNYSDGVDLYWLGGNVLGKIETGCISRHGPNSVQPKITADFNKKPPMTVITTQSGQEVQFDSEEVYKTMGDILEEIILKKLNEYPKTIEFSQQARGSGKTITFFDPEDNPRGGTGKCKNCGQSSLDHKNTAVGFACPRLPSPPDCPSAMI